MRFVVATEGSNRLGLAQLLEEYANEQWLPDHLTEEQAVGWVVDQFKRAVAAEIEMLDVRAVADSTR